MKMKAGKKAPVKMNKTPVMGIGAAAIGMAPKKAPAKAPARKGSKRGY